MAVEYFLFIIKQLLQYENNINNISSFEIVIDSNHFVKNKKLFDNFFEYETNLIKNKNQVKLNRDTDGFIHFVKVDCTYFDKLKLIVSKNKINSKIINIRHVLK